MAKGDYVVIRGSVQAEQVMADRAGRKVETSWEKDGNLQWFVAQLQTRGGTVVQEVRFVATDIQSIRVFRKETP